MDASKPLSPIKRELFAQELYKGITASQAYVNAGYKYDRGNASELANTDSIKQRVTYLLQLKAMRKGITVDSLCDELERDREHARRIDQPAAAMQATMNQAKLMGMLIERKESGKVGEFASMSVDELRKQLKADLDALEAMRAKPKGESSH